MTDFLKNGVYTPDGKRVVDTLNAWVEAALKDPSPERFNGLPGHAKHWGINVVMMHAIRPEQWLEEHTTAAEAVLDVLTEAEHKEAAAQQQTDLEKRLTMLEGVVQQQQALLEQAEAAAKKKKKGAKPMMDEEDDPNEPEPDADADDAKK